MPSLCSGWHVMFFLCIIMCLPIRNEEKVVMPMIVFLEPVGRRE